MVLFLVLWKKVKRLLYSVKVLNIHKMQIGFPFKMLSLLILIVGASLSIAQKPVKWAFSKEKLSETQYNLVFTATIEEGWNSYSMFTEDNGPIATAITFEEKSGIKLEGKPQEFGDIKVGFDNNFGVNVTKVTPKKPYVIKQKVTIINPSKPLAGYVTYMVCNDVTCLPPTDVDFSHSFPASGVAPTSKPDEKKNEVTEPDQDQSKVAENNAIKVVMTEVVDSNLASVMNSDSSAMIASQTADGIITPRYKIENGFLDQRIPALFESAKNPKANCGTEIKESKGWFWTFLFGFGGGLLALLTPCVFPMLPITVSFFTKDTKRKGWMNGLLYGLSIIVIYVGLGLLVTMFFGAETLNRLSTNWIANTLFFLIFIFFAFSFFGFYEITLPSSWTTKTDSMADRGGLLGIFFMAFTLALVSFSCTGPIVGTALVQAATKGEIIGPFLVMFGFSLALALPFGLFAAFPSWLNSLPRSGSWMNSVKVVLGFLELALAFKFLSVADMTNHWGVLRYEPFMIIWVLVFIGIALYLFGFIKFPHDSPIKKLSALRMSFATIAGALVIYLLSGFTVNKTTNSYNGLSLMSGLAPPTQYNFFLKPSSLDEQIKAKYPSYSKCANNINCFKDYYEGLSYAKEVNKPIMLDFTGYGCVNCRKTEEHIWVDDRVRGMLNDSLVLISLYSDDDTVTPDELKSLRSRYSNERIRNVGKYWADFQMSNFESIAQPLYVVINTQQEVITSPRPFREGVGSYVDFLECGLINAKN